MKAREYRPLPVARDDRAACCLAADEPCEREVDLQALLHRLPVALVVHSPDGAVRYVNAAASEFGLTEAELYGRPATDPAWHFLR